MRKFDEQRYWEEHGFRSCSDWLGFHCGFGPCAAREHHPGTAEELYLAREATCHYDDDGCLVMKVRMPARPRIATRW
jgi:hypothetical protein